MDIRHISLLLLAVVGCLSERKKCDQTPPQATVLTPQDVEGLFQLTISNAKDNNFIPLQTYVLTLETTNLARNFTWFMITAEDPDVDDSIFDVRNQKVDVGILKTLDNSMSRYSERCANTVEGFDNVKKPKVEVHWVSPANTERVRLRAMVAENSENWYTGGSLDLVLERDKAPPRDEPPIAPNPVCKLCSEARYEVIFKGRWSRLEHPRHYPNKPDENGYSHMIGASHAYNFTLWEPGSEANPGMVDLATASNVTTLERYIIQNMAEEGGTRTLIRGKKHVHPNMHKWSHALFRVDRIHHLFSIAVAIRPSPDWFLGTKMFELCTDDGWFEYKELPLYPWDAGVKDGVSYDRALAILTGFMRCSQAVTWGDDGMRQKQKYCALEWKQVYFKSRERGFRSPTSQTQPKENIKRVEVGSFDIASPFYQTNLNDLRPFAYLEVRRLDVYTLHPDECPDLEDNTENQDEEAVEEEEEPQDDSEYEPRVAESRQSSCSLGEWSAWSPCVPDVGSCGIGAQTRTRVAATGNLYGDSNDDIQVLPHSTCKADGDPYPMEIRDCEVPC